MHAAGKDISHNHSRSEKHGEICFNAQEQRHGTYHGSGHTR